MTMKVVNFVVAVCVVGLPLAVSSNEPYILVELNTSWNSLCQSLLKFRIDIGQISSIPDSLIAVRNANENCKNGGLTTAPIEVRLSIFKESGNAEVDVKATLKARDALKNANYIGNYKIRSVEARNVPRQTLKFSDETILTIIGIVLVIYLIGYFLILGVKSYSLTDTSDRPLSFVLAAENKYFVDGIRRHKSTQYNVSIATRKSIYD